MRHYTPDAHRAAFRAALAFLLSAACLAPAAAWSQSSDMRVVKTAPATVNAGTDLTYSITVTNNGPNDAPNAIMVDAVPAGTTFVSAITQPGFACTLPPVGGSGTITCSQALMVSGAVANFSMTVHIGASVPSGSPVGNQAQVGSTNPDPAPGDEQSTVFTTVTASADLFVLKSGPASVIPGQNTAYTIQFSNNGPSDAQGVVLNDPLPAGTTFVSENQDFGPGFTCTNPAVGGTGSVNCTIATLPVGAFGQFTLVVKIGANVLDGTLVQNNTTLVSATSDPNPSSNSSNTTAQATAFADLQVTKVAPATASAGQNLTFNLTVVNVGPSDSQFVTLTDIIPAGTTYVSATQNTGPAASCTAPPVGGTGSLSCGFLTLAAGASATFDLTVLVDAAAPSGSLINNGLNASAATVDPVPASNLAFTATTVQTFANIGVSKTGPATADAGTDITYSIAAGNAGPSDALNFALFDGMPPGTTFVSGSQTVGPAFSCTFPPVGGTGTMSCSIATLPPTQFGVFTLVVHVPSGVPAGSLVGNSATVVSTTPDPTPGDNSSSVATTVTVSADVQVTKSGPATINAGSNITYSLTVTNAGPSDAQAVNLSDTLPAGTTFVSNVQNTGPVFSCTTPAVGAAGTVTCNLATLAPGVSASFTLVANVASATASGASIANTAAVSSTTTDPTPGNNSATATATVTTSADLQVTKTGPPSAPTSSVLTYNLSLLNAGPSDALAVSFSDTLPAGTTFISFAQNSGPAFTCTTPAVGGTGTVTCTMASLAANAGGMFTLVIQALPSLLGGSVVTNTATATTTTNDPTPANNSATAVTNITAITTFSGPSATGSGTVTATFVGGGPACAFSSAALIPVTGGPGSPPASAPGITFPHGLFTFTTTNCVAGSTLTFTITYPSSVERMTYWKYGPTPGAPKPHWYILPATFTGQVAVFSITDGQMGDDDLLANGTIVDQGGPGVGTPPVPTLSEWMQWLLAALLLAMGMRAMRGRGRI